MKKSELLENKTDAIVENARIKSDKARSVRRSEIDQGMSGADFQSQRHAEDKALDSERLAFDVALGNEREAHLSTQSQLTTREEILAIVSHDLRNPIGAISSCADMLLTDESYIDMSDELKNWIEFIKRNADSSLRLIGDILDMERISEGKIALQTQSQDLSKLIAEAVADHSQAARAKSITLSASELPKMEKIGVDRDRISQVLSNLIGNAIKFTPVGGAIRIQVLALEKEIQIAIQDSGPGIADEKKSRIFERFTQIHDKDRRGLGLGLYISKMFVELHKGRLWVESTLGQGSTFYFTLPKAGEL